MTPEETRQVLHVAARAEAADGTGPLDEATLLEIRMRPDDVRGWVRPEGFGLLIEDQIHLCVDPDQRDSGVGGELLEALLTEAFFLTFLDPASQQVRILPVLGVSYPELYKSNLWEVRLVLYWSMFVQVYRR